jgi:hypothetical protein
LRNGISEKGADFLAGPAVCFKPALKPGDYHSLTRLQPVMHLHHNPAKTSNSGLVKDSLFLNDWLHNLSSNPLCNQISAGSRQA